jgi:hypothetical protein
MGTILSMYSKSYKEKGYGLSEILSLSSQKPPGLLDRGMKASPYLEWGRGEEQSNRYH